MAVEDSTHSLAVENGPSEKAGMEGASDSQLKTLNGIVLVPQPTESIHDPLNLTQWKKEAIFAVITFAVFSSTVSPMAGQLNLAAQAKLYNKTTTQESYANSAAIAGLAAGPYLFSFFTLRMGRSAVIFWSLLGLLACQIWAALMTRRTEYIGYIMSRLIAGIFGSVVGVVGPRILIDIFYLHERGRRFALLFCVNLFGSVVGPTLSGFISAQTSWPVEYWWTVGLLALVLCLCFVLLEETGFDRVNGDDEGKHWPTPPQSWASNRVATFLFGQSLQPKYSARATAQACVNPFLILICPVTILAGLFGLVNFGVYVGVNSLAPVFLQEPMKKGGYGFTVLQNAEFSFNHWIGMLVVIAYTFLISDSLPLAICRRYGSGIWKPEYRLYAIIIPGLLTPIGCGIWGAGLEYQLHYMVLALASFIVTIGSFSTVSILANYVVECFIEYPVDAAMSSTLFRIVWGLSIPFYINQWAAEVGVGWAYGTMAFMALAACGFIFILLLVGHQVREFSFRNVNRSEEGTKLIEVVV